MLSSGRPWRGIRVRYRKANTRGKFNSFLLSTDDETIPSFEMIEQAVGRHSTGRQ